MIAAALVFVVAAALRIWTDFQVSAVNVGHTSSPSTFRSVVITTTHNHHHATRATGP
ncbi:hypothetical protein [Rhodococcus sp. NBC_00297]|uniref:hypothetical protein n=1 Tax=Rhodococcus sp. NBC_00297 TaxID=2976005 RepID=UPI002E28745C|nr:hypothetical protein [Rhodococcus sp. NBC_00297]